MLLKLIMLIATILCYRHPARDKNREFRREYSRNLCRFALSSPQPLVLCHHHRGNTNPPGIRPQEQKLKCTAELLINASLLASYWILSIFFVIFLSATQPTAKYKPGLLSDKSIFPFPQIISRPDISYIFVGEFTSMNSSNGLGKIL